MSHPEVPIDKNTATLGRLSWWLLCCVIISLGILPIRIPFGSLEVGLTELIVLFSIPFWCIAFMRIGLSQPGRLTRIAIAVYLLTAIVSALFSNSVARSLKHILGEVYLVFLFLVLANLVADEGKVRSAVLSWLIGLFVATLIALGTILIYYFDSQNPLLPYLTYHYGSVPVGNFPRVTATFPSASMLFNYVSIGIVLSFCSLKNRWVPRGYLFLLIGAALIVSVFTFSIGLGSYFLIFAWWAWLTSRGNSKMRFFVILVFVLAALSWLVLAFVSLQSFPEATFYYSFSAVPILVYPSARYLVWQETLHTIGNHFLLGIGPGNPVCNVVFTNTDGSLSLLTDAHNTFLNVMAERGVFGAAGFIITVFLVIRPGFALHHNGSWDTSKVITNGLAFALLISVGYQGLVGSFEDAGYLWVLMGMAVAANNYGQTSTVVTSSPA